MTGEVTQQARGPVHPDQEHPCRHRVEGAGVADLLGPEQPAAAADNLVRRPALRLVDHHQPVTTRKL
jgi:hypothetical protein